MRRKKKRLGKLALLVFSACVGLITYSYIYASSTKDNNVISKAMNVLTSKDEKQSAEALRQEEAKKAEEAKRLEEEKARLEQWKQGLEVSIREYFGEDISKVGVIYYDIESGQKIAINENNLFKAASTVKVQMNMIAYDWIRDGKLSLSEGIKYTSKDNAAGTGRLLADFKKSQPIPLSTLLDYSIKYSDNIATNMILRTLGGSVEVRTMANTMVGTNTDTSQNWVTPEQELKVLQKLYEKREDEHYSHLIDVMKNTTFHDRIDKYLPQDRVAHKIGDYATYVNDVSIVFAEKPYILVVYTNELPGLAAMKPHEKIAGLSKLIYEAHEAK